MLYNISAPTFLRKFEGSLCDTCRYRNMDDDEIPCWDCMETTALFDDDTGREFMQRCRTHLRSLPAAISGQAGTAQTQKVASVIFHDLALDDVNGWILLLEYNTRCQPAWPVENLRRFMQQVLDNPPKDRPRGMIRDVFVAEIDSEE